MLRSFDTADLLETHGGYMQSTPLPVKHTGLSHLVTIHQHVIIYKEITTTGCLEFVTGQSTTIIIISDQMTACEEIELIKLYFRS